MIEYFLILISVFSTVISLILFKKASGILKYENGLLKFIKSLFNYYLISAIFLVGVSVVSYNLALSSLDLIIVFSFNSLTPLFVFFSGVIFFGEKINRYHVIGISLITIGLFFINVA
ncbi:EamA family transporter [Promethearchaeum syntrophicum]|uniref:EamA family transporter n=1 Tax=Promethearchaeum syntrophicum TaxID=2594042 RepID=A0A5B9DB09_9ARCH|nr:EamA family transporter [Candidatus Prometheoarchaeum syntrophicum]QEE16017.1 4-amino-4-deoxy-L-arabinose-phosphoundecaprenol flippase subunit ArnE [Candidatus Prometheoarchaeum syntrophicum]